MPRLVKYWIFYELNFVEELNDNFRNSSQNFVITILVEIKFLIMNLIVI